MTPPVLTLPTGRTHPRTATPRPCPNCQAPTLHGLDGDLCTFACTTDQTLLTPLGEALAHLDGRHTYELRHRAAGYALTRRDRWQIGGRIAGEFFHVVPDHRCGAAMLPNVGSVIVVKAMSAKKGKVSNERAPF